MFWSNLCPRGTSFGGGLDRTGSRAVRKVEQGGRDWFRRVKKNLQGGRVRASFHLQVPIQHRNFRIIKDGKPQTRKEILRHPSIVLFEMIWCRSMTKYIHEEQCLVFFWCGLRFWAEPARYFSEEDFVILHVLEHLLESWIGQRVVKKWGTSMDKIRSKLRSNGD